MSLSTTHGVSSNGVIATDNHGGYDNSNGEGCSSSSSNSGSSSSSSSSNSSSSNGSMTLLKRKGPGITTNGGGSDGTGVVSYFNEVEKGNSGNNSNGNGNGSSHGISDRGNSDLPHKKRVRISTIVASSDASARGKPFK